MKQQAIFEFMIIFDPSETWTNVYQLDSDFAAFLKTKGLEAQVLTPLGGSTRRIINITKMEEMPPVSMPNPGTSASPGDILKNLSQKTGFDGKFRKNG